VYYLNRVCFFYFFVVVAYSECQAKNTVATAVQEHEYLSIKKFTVKGFIVFSIVVDDICRTP
jgi:hypothetical protein